MKIKILVLGANSFLGMNFLNLGRDIFEFYPVVRRKIGLVNEIVVPDLFELDENYFRKVDVVINFAAIVHKPNVDNEVLYNRINYELPLHAAKKAKQNGCNHFIQLSSISVYGKNKIINNQVLEKPYNFYGMSKLKADKEISKLADSNFIVSSIRPSMVYGGGASPGNMKSLISLVKTGMPLPFGGIKNTRNFINVNNLSQIIVKVIRRKIKGVIIAADEESISTSYLINVISDKLNKPNRNFKFKLFWKLIKVIKPNLYEKLLGDLEVKNTYSFKDLDLDKVYTVEEGVLEMVEAN